MTFMRIAVIHNDIPPYRLGLFYRFKNDLKCDFFLTKLNESFRKWDKVNSLE